MIIELKEYELPKGKAPFDATAYSETGLFFVNDGVATFIVSVAKVGEPPFTIPMPIDVLTRHIRHKSARETESDISAKLIGRLEEINNKIGKLSDSKKEKSTPKETGISELTLLRAISLVQNPELAKDLIK